MYITDEWLAGFVEGDGCFSVNSQQGGKYVYPKIEIHQKNLEPLEAVRDTFGMRFYPNVRLGIVSCTGKPAQDIYSRISPWLSSKRVSQAEFRGFVTSPRKSPGLEWFAGYYEAEGCIHTKTNGQVKADGTKTLFAAMTISQYYSDETSRLCKEVLGLGRVAGPYMARGERRAYSFNLSGQDAIGTVESIKHMLSMEKQTQLEKVAKLCHK